MKKRKVCPDCKATDPTVKYFIRHKSWGNNQYSRSSSPWPGFNRCKNEFHGPAWL